MAAAVANKDCDPFTPREQPCLPGQSVAFSVNASGPADFARAIRFAQSENIRLVIHNTGHDYLGKSTGKGALSVWTHYMKDVQFVDYNSAYYTGPAIKLGAGVQVEEAYEAAHQRNALVVGGDCATVGVVGGYLQGGGHSALSSLYGLAADHTLEWEVVDGTGRLHIATPERNADLYWALSGGGGGTYGIASSVTIKLHPDLPLTGVAMSFDLDPQHPQAFHRAVSKYHELVPRITASRGMGIAAITNSSFLLTPLTLPHVSGTGAIDLIMPLLTELDDQGVRYGLNITESPNWLEYWTRLIKPNPTQLVENGQYGGWMVPRSVVEADGDDLHSAVQHITDAGCTFVGLALNVSLPEGGSRVRNSVLPAWREAAMNVILST
ncbi:hypothetical protein SLS56_010346 [Neofusicoccum ribis]|uniref:FAD-binding PCMH-type domain-containing protein n=1 Tax=Neofusicoccum ribis TaxID=45134 RepID=A0ABR3SF99_9PEZI